MRIFNLVCCLGMALPAVAQEVEEFAFVLPVTTQSSEGLQRIPLPATVHQGAVRGDLGDLRVYNAKAEKLSFAFAQEPRKEATPPKEFALPFFPLVQVQTASNSGALNLQVRQLADGTLVSLHSGSGKTVEKKRITGYLVDASKADAAFNAMVVDWTVTPQTQSGRLRVEASDDLAGWRTVTADAPLVDLEHGGERLVQKRVTLPVTKARYWRLTWQREGFELKSLRAESPTEDRSPTYASLRFEARNGDKPGEYLFDLGGRVPVERVLVELPQANTVAPSRLLMRSDPKLEWRAGPSATFYRFNRDGTELVSPPVATPAIAERYWLLRVDQKGGGIGSGMPRLVVEWQPRSLVFVARGEGPYKVAYGNAAVGPATFGIAELMPGYKPGSEYSLPAVQLGAASRQEARVPSAMQTFMRDTSGKKVALWSVLLVGVGLLGWMAWRLNGDLKPASPAPGKAPDA